MFKKIFVIFCFLYLCPLILFCHPHLFIKPSIEILSNDITIKGIKIIWEWDKWWSEDVINECDIDKNGAFDNKEIQLIYKNFFSGVKDFNYFTEIFLNGDKLKINTISNFNAYTSNDLVTYDFIIPLEKKVENIINVKIRFNDETIYTAFDGNINLKKSDNYEFSNLKVNEFSYYGIQISFDLL